MIARVSLRARLHQDGILVAPGCFDMIVVRRWYPVMADARAIMCPQIGWPVFQVGLRRWQRQHHATREASWLGPISR